jgi:uncharacterized protein YbjT (DUF2867 family)
MYVILGATGNTGSVVAKKLLDSGKKVRVVGRDANKLSPLVSQGAEAVTADVTDPAALTQVLGGAEAVYALIPPNMQTNDFRVYQDQVTGATATALEDAHIKHAVMLSSIGADKPDKTGPVVGLHLLEERLNQIANLNVLHLRAGYFMENLLPQIGIIQNFGTMAGPLRADLQLPLIATQDIGEFAANALLDLNFSGKETQELLGQRDISYQELARIVGNAIGKPALAYAQLPSQQVIQAMSSMGISTNVATLLCEMSESLNSGYMKPLEARSAKNTTPTSFETFVNEKFVPAFRAKAAGA